MAPQFLPQCTLGNKNVSAARKVWVVNLPTPRAPSGIAVLSDWLENSHNSCARLGAVVLKKGAGLLSERQHVQAEPAAHDPEQQHGLESQRQRGRGRRAMAAEARYQRDTEHDIHQEC